ncbi:MAG TPA: signal peptidase II [Candidatus Dormibacteraeota bacterium]|nr:signal peptidase II [Candidatus Dormibacteraeota bacterium]
MPRRRALLIVAAIALVVALLDQVSKAWARGWLTPGHEVTVIPGWLWFRLASNSGATLGLGTGLNELFAVLALIVVGAIAVLALRGNVGGLLGVAALGAVAGGAIGNLADRVRLGGVTDFIEVHLWPTDFNLADAAIRLGVVLFVLALVLDWTRRPGRDSLGAGRER